MVPFDGGSIYEYLDGIKARKRHPEFLNISLWRKLRIINGLGAIDSNEKARFWGGPVGKV
jgi:hypothetical protein